MPYSFYLLCHLPAPGNEENRNKSLAVTIRFIYNCLRSSLRQGSDNLSYLIQQINLLTSQYKHCDATVEGGGIPLSMITKVADQLLNDSIKTVENVQPFKGNPNP